MRVLDFAMEMERRGRDFYRRLAQEADGEGVKTVYAAMADDEERLLRTFRAMAEKGSQADSRALEEMERPAIPEADALAADSVTGAYYRLMETERDLCRFYEEAARRETNPAAREQLLRVASEEEREFRLLETTYDFVNAPNEYLAWREFSNLDEFHNFGRYEDNRECRHTA